MKPGFQAGLRRELREMGSTKTYLFGMVLVPVLIVVFFLSLLHSGLPNRVPTDRKSVV